jgi:hypothetical protein
VFGVPGVPVKSSRWLHREEPCGLRQHLSTPLPITIILIPAHQTIIKLLRQATSTLFDLISSGSRKMGVACCVFGCGIRRYCRWLWDWVTGLKDC